MKDIYSKEDFGKIICTIYNEAEIYKMYNIPYWIKRVPTRKDRESIFTIMDNKEKEECFIEGQKRFDAKPLDIRYYSRYKYMENSKDPAISHKIGVIAEKKCFNINGYEFKQELYKGGDNGIDWVDPEDSENTIAIRCITRMGESPELKMTYKEYNNYMDGKKKKPKFLWLFRWNEEIPEIVELIGSILFDDFIKNSKSYRYKESGPMNHIVNDSYLKTAYF